MMFSGLLSVLISLYPLGFTAGREREYSSSLPNICFGQAHMTPNFPGYYGTNGSTAPHDVALPFGMLSALDLTTAFEDAPSDIATPA